jgi:Pvc16 N-terminal domain
MSNALALGAVTAVLRDLLNNGLIDQDMTGTIGGNVTVTALPPDRIDIGENREKSQLNLFLYQVTPNQGWRNVGLPSRDARGDRVANPPLALDLHYLLTAYGEQEFHGEILLGYAMQTLHETPVLPRDAIRLALGAPPPVTGSGLPPAQQALVAAELADQIEQIKILPQSLSTEEMSRLWTALHAHYRPSAVYQASVVLIESKRSRKSALPVRTRNVAAITWRRPVIEAVEPVAGPDEWIFEGTALVIRGIQLRGAVTRVRFGEVELTPAPNDLADTRIAATVPVGLRAGVQSVQVLHRLDLGTTSPDEPHRGFESNVGAFVLHATIGPPAVAAPAVAGVTPTLQNGVPVVVDGVTLQSAAVTVSFAPRVGRRQRVLLLLNELEPPSTRASRSYSFPAPADNGIVPPTQEDTATIVFPIAFVAPGGYLVRAQVDGAESPLGVDAAGKYVSPAITI